VSNVLGPSDDITRFEYMQKTDKESGPAVVGIELACRADYDALMENMKKYLINFTEINKNDTLFSLLV